MTSNFVRHPRPKSDFGSSLTDDKFIDSLVDDVIVKETGCHPLVGEANERCVVSVKEVSNKEWRYCNRVHFVENIGLCLPQDEQYNIDNGFIIYR